MEKPSLVDSGQALEQREEHESEFFIAQERRRPDDILPFLDDVLQRLSDGQRHHHVGGAVSLEVIVHVDDARNILEVRQDLGLFQKVVTTPLKLLDALGRGRQHHRLALADGQTVGQIFLDGDPAAEIVGREIGGAEAAPAKHGADGEALDARAFGQHAMPRLALRLAGEVAILIHGAHPSASTRRQTGRHLIPAVKTQPTREQGSEDRRATLADHPV